MKPKISVYIAVSLDGFIARLDGSLDWLPGADGTAEPGMEGEDFGYHSFIEQIDCMVMGRGTFETVQAFGEWPYTGKRVLVMSGRMPMPKGYEDKIEISTERPATLSERLAAEQVKHIYLDGGKLVQSFLKEGLVDTLIITRVPVLIGSGRPLFGPLPDDISLKHDWTKSFANGFVQSCYSTAE